MRRRSLPDQPGGGENSETECECDYCESGKVFTLATVVFDLGL
jgi:hypothetical protein